MQPHTGDSILKTDLFMYITEISDHTVQDFHIALTVYVALR